MLTEKYLNILRTKLHIEWVYYCSKWWVGFFSDRLKNGALWVNIWELKARDTAVYINIMSVFLPIYVMYNIECKNGQHIFFIVRLAHCRPFKISFVWSADGAPPPHLREKQELIPYITSIKKLQDFNCWN
jgi:hypothetical protein